MNTVRSGLALLFAFAVFAFGGVEVWSISVIEIGTALLLIVWAGVILRNPEIKLVWNPLNWPLLGLIALGAAQLLFQRSQYAFLTRVTLLQLSTYFLIFFLCTQAFHQRKEMTRLAWFLVSLCFVVSLFGITQHFTSERKIYWFRDLTAGGDLFGPFVNRNHFAGFVGLTLPIGLSLMVFRGLRRDVFPLATLLTVVPVGALILSGSRGGIIALAFEIGMFVLLVRSRRSTDGPRMVAIGAIALVALVLVLWLGAGRALERFSQLHTDDVTLSRRATMVHGAIRVFRTYPIWGSGLGTLVAVYPKFETLYDGRIVDHVHNDYVELLAEMGILGAVCGIAFLWILFRDSRACFNAEQGHFSRALHAGAVVGLAGLLLHSFVDFNLHIPSNALLFLLLTHIATSAPLPSQSAPRQRSRGRASRESASAER